MTGPETESQSPELSAEEMLLYCVGTLGRAMTNVALHPEDLVADVAHVWTDGGIPETILPRIPTLYFATHTISETWGVPAAKKLLFKSDPKSGGVSLLSIIAQRDPADAEIIVRDAVKSRLG